MVARLCSSGPRSSGCESRRLHATTRFDEKAGPPTKFSHGAQVSCLQQAGESPSLFRGQRKRSGPASGLRTLVAGSSRKCLGFIAPPRMPVRPAVATLCRFRSLHSNHKRLHEVHGSNRSTLRTHPPKGAPSAGPHRSRWGHAWNAVIKPARRLGSDSLFDAIRVGGLGLVFTKGINLMQAERSDRRHWFPPRLLLWTATQAPRASFARNGSSHDSSLSHRLEAYRSAFRDRHRLP